MVYIRGMSILSFSGQHVTDGFIDIKVLPEDDRVRSKHVIILTNCTEKINLALVQLLFYFIYCFLMYGNN
jgi:hypothetical protein